MAIPFSNKADVKTNLQGIETKQKKKKERKKERQSAYTWVKNISAQFSKADKALSEHNGRRQHSYNS